MNNAPAYWMTHPACRRHAMGDDHPECPRRLDAIEGRLLSGGLDLFMQRSEAPQASIEDLLKVHDADLIESVLRPVPAGRLERIDPDTLVNEFTAEAALRAAGAGQQAVKMVLEEQASFVFCSVRPPGHHAERARSMGFCFFNNVAVAAAEALAHGLKRIAILDFDVHYGNGTADIFRNEPRVRMFSTYQHPLYPHWEGDAKAANMIDVPLPPGTGSIEFREAVEMHWWPALEEFRPQIILVSAGFDAHIADEMADLRLHDEDYAWLGERILAISERHCPGRVVATLEGGYDLGALSRGVEAFVRPFVGA